MATEVDYSWTYVGGSQALIDELVAGAEIEAFPVLLSDGAFYDSDTVNANADDNSGLGMFRPPWRPQR